MSDQENDQEDIAFQQPLITTDPYILSLYQKYNLGDAPSLEEIEDVAMKLLDNVHTMAEAAALVLTRQVRIDEPDLAMSLCNPASTAQDRFLALLLVRSLENL